MAPERDAPRGAPSDERLRAALAPGRPDRETFLAGVRRRVDEGERARDEAEARLAAQPERIRRAASFLPPGTIPFALSAAGAAAKPAGWKALPGFVALPALAMAMLLVTFAGGLRSVLRREPGSPATDVRLEDVVAAWWQRHVKAIVAAFVLLLALAVTRHGEAAMLALGVSMLVAVTLVRELARAGLATRETTARTVSNLLFALGLHGWYFGPFFSAWLFNPASTVLFVAGVLIRWRGGVTTWSDVRRFLLHPLPLRWPDRLTVFCLRTLTFSAAALALFFTLAVTAFSVVWFASSLPAQGPSAAPPAAWRDFVPTDGEDAAFAAEALARAQAGLGPDERRRLADDARERFERARAEADLVALAHLDDLLALLGETPASAPVREAVLAACIDEDLRRPEAVAFAPTAELARGWDERPRTKREVLDSLVGHADVEPAVIEATLAALALTERHGVPEELDLRAVRAVLRSPQTGWPFSSEARFGVLRTEALLARAGRPIGTLERILEHRVLLGALLLALLAAAAVARAPRAEELRTGGSGA